VWSVNFTLAPTFSGACRVHRLRIHHGLMVKAAPEHSIPGIILACVSLIAMPLLSLGSAAMQADATQTEFCTYLSAILLIGLVLNARSGLWWADPLTGIVMVPIIAKEGVEALTR
jgi:divalent metal cation (Fe/Co/Zn/Cd) transporter